jgi:hypothetical protein
MNNLKYKNANNFFFKSQQQNFFFFGTISVVVLLTPQTNTMNSLSKSRSQVIGSQLTKLLHLPCHHPILGKTLGKKPRHEQSETKQAQTKQK